MDRIAPARIASILESSSWMDRLDLTSPSAEDRSRAAMMIATAITDVLDRPERGDADPRQIALPIL